MGLRPFSILYLIASLHQTTTPHCSAPSCRNCILLLHYIKPQHYVINDWLRFHCILLLHYIKPQHLINYYERGLIVSYCFTTSNHNAYETREYQDSLYLIASPHQTTTQERSIINGLTIVSYCFTTSNHNWLDISIRWVLIVSYCFTTSNHNCFCRSCSNLVIVSYCFTTSNHNAGRYCL